MKMDKRGLLSIIIVIVVLLAVILIVVVIGIKKSANKVNVNVTGECSIDSDCVPAACCHPKGCVTKEQQPNCKGMLCTQDCEPGTLDCGQGECKCLNNKCEAIFK